MDVCACMVDGMCVYGMDRWVGGLWVVCVRVRNDVASLLKCLPANQSTWVQAQPVNNCCFIFSPLGSLPRPR